MVLLLGRLIGNKRERGKDQCHEALTVIQRTEKYADIEHAKSVYNKWG